VVETINNSGLASFNAISNIRTNLRKSMEQIAKSKPTPVDFPADSTDMSGGVGFISLLDSDNEDEANDKEGNVQESVITEVTNQAAEVVDAQEEVDQTAEIPAKNNELVNVDTTEAPKVTEFIALDDDEEDNEAELVIEEEQAVAIPADKLDLNTCSDAPLIKDTALTPSQSTAEDIPVVATDAAPTEATPTDCRKELTPGKANRRRSKQKSRLLKTKRQLLSAKAKSTMSQLLKPKMTRNIPFRNHLIAMRMAKQNSDDKFEVTSSSVTANSLDVLALEDSMAGVSTKSAAKDQLHTTLATESLESQPSLFHRPQSAASIFNQLSGHKSNITQSSDEKEVKVYRLQQNDKFVDNVMRKSVLNGMDTGSCSAAPRLQQDTYKSKADRKRKAEETAGPAWYHLPKTEVTPEIRREMQLIKMRGVLDSKNHYKRNDTNKLPKYFQMGTVVEGKQEFHSARMTNKQRKGSMLDELLSDAKFRAMNKKKYLEIQKQYATSGGNKYKGKKKKTK